MVNPKVAYFFKRFYRNIIKCWFVIYNPIARIISYSKEDEEYTKKLNKEKEEKKKERAIKYAEANGLPIPEEYAEEKVIKPHIEDVNYNETTGSFSGLYGQKPVDSGTQSMLDEIMGKTSSQNNIDSLLSQQVAPAPKPKEEVEMSPEQEAVIQEANEIYERLLREAAEDEAKKQAEIEEAKQQAATEFPIT